MQPPAIPQPPAVQTARWLLRPIAFLEAARRQFGDAFSVNFVGFQTPLIMVSHPDAVRALYTERSHGLPPGRSVSLLPIVGPRSVLLLEGPEHLARRRVMLPPFHGERMRAYEPVVRDIARRDTEAWPSEPFAVHPRMQAVTLEVIIQAVFGVVDPERRDRLRERLAGLLDSTASVGLQARVMLHRRFGGPDPLVPLQRVKAEIDALLLEEIGEHRRSPDDRDDILSLLVAARFEDGEPMSDAEIRDQLMTLLLAGHETTATALAWTFDLLAHHPHVLARLHEELDAGEDAYLRAVIAEALRLRPVVPLAGRRLATEMQVNGMSLPPGTDVTPAIWLTHTRADTYPDPYAFRPERFLDASPSTYAWIPFGGGVRRCLGAAFAEMEMRVVLSEALRLKTVRPTSRRPEHLTRRNITFSPKRGTRVVASDRASAS